MIKQKYMRRPYYITVVRWIPENWKEIQKWLDELDVNYERNGDSLRVQTLCNTGAWMKVNIGDALFADAAGGLLVMTPRELVGLYEKVY